MAGFQRHPERSVEANTDSILTADHSTFLILTVHLTGRIADGLPALLNAIYPQE